MITVWGTGVLGLQHIFCWGNSSTYNWVLGLGFAAVFFYAYRAGRISQFCLPQLPPFGQLYDRMPFWKGLPALGRVSCICNPSTQQVEAEGFGVPGASGPYSRLSTTSKQTVRNLPSAQLLTVSPRCHKRLGCFPLSESV